MIRLEHADRRSLLVVARATSRLLRSTGPEEVAAVLRDVVVELGGTVVPAAEEPAEALPFDLSCGIGTPVLALAAPGSRARARLEHALPGLLEDARVALARATHDHRLEELVQVDWLTGLLSRRVTERLVARLDPRDTVAVLDLDRFKEVNDRHGHAAGDEVLASFGRLLRDRARAEDRYGRLGGEEFVGVFPGMSPVAVVEALERLRADWSRVAPYGTTFSAGVAAVGTDGGERALQAADEALYAAKAAGRDRTRVALPGPRTPLDAARPRPAPGPLRSSALPTLMRHLTAGRVREATDLVLNLLDAGATLSEVITELLAPAQLEVGRRWQTARWSVAEEHVATSVIDAVLAAATFRAGQPPPEDAREPVLVVCPEGEWHQLPSRMFAALLAEQGLSVVQLGPSLPARDLHRLLTGSRYRAVVLSCTLATSLMTGAKVVRVAHEAGLPVLAGGRAFGLDDRRALAVGADAWARDAASAAGVLRAWSEHLPPLATPGVVPVTQPLVDAVGPHARTRAVEEIRRRHPSLVPDAPGALAATYADIGHVLRHLDAALAVDDPELFLEFSRWLVVVLTSRGLPAEAVTAGYEAVEEVLGPRHARAVALLQQARTALAAEGYDEPGQATDDVVAPAGPPASVNDR